MGDSLGTNTVYGEALRTSGVPGYGTATVEPVAAAPAQEPVVVTEEGVTEQVVTAEVVPIAAAPVDRCAPIALSAGAVGRPCWTTDQFIHTLGLSAKNQARALSMVAKAEQTLAH